MALEMRSACERCGNALLLGGEAAICSYECTFCADCVDRVLQNVCPNCGGGFTARPIRPQRAWREGTGLVNDPPGPGRRHASYTLEEIGAFAEPLRDIDPGAR